jgi:hypothetical protein
LVKLTDSAHEKTTEGLEKKWCFVGFSDIFWCTAMCLQWFAVQMLGGYRALQNCDWWNGHPQPRWNFSWKPKLGVPIGLDLHRNCLNNFQTREGHFTGGIRRVFNLIISWSHCRWF